MTTNLQVKQLSKLKQMNVSLSKIGRKQMQGRHAQKIAENHELFR